MKKSFLFIYMILTSIIFAKAWNINSCFKIETNKGYEGKGQILPKGNANIIHIQDTVNSIIR